MATIWRGGDDDDTSKRRRGKLRDGAGTDEMMSVVSFVKHHLVSQKIQENFVNRNGLLLKNYSPNYGGK